MNELPTLGLPRISSIPGPRGPKGDTGAAGGAGTNGVSPRTTTTSSFVMPAGGGAVTVPVVSTAWVVTGQPIFIESAGSFVATSILSPTSLNLTAQVATGNAAPGVTIASGKAVTTGALMEVPTAVLTGIYDRLTVVENATPGNSTLYATSTPSGDGRRIGDIWYRMVSGNVTGTFRWDGTGWVDVFKVLEEADFGTGIRPIVKVDTLPASGYVDGDFVWLSTNGKLYRRVAGAWTAAIPTGDLTGQIDGTMIVDGTLVAAKLAANSVTADKVGANQIITLAANIGDAVITSAKIESISAGKITAGDIQVVNIGHSGRLFHKDYITGAYANRYFKATEFGTSFADAKVFGTGSAFAFSHCTPVTAYGPGAASWRVGGSPAMCPDSSGTLFVQIQGRLIGYTGLICIYGQKNSEPHFALAATTSSVDGSATINTMRNLTGIAPTDTVKIFVAPCNGSGDAVPGITCRYEIDVIFYNW